MLVLVKQSNETMNNKISTGIWFVFAGLIFLLHNLNIIHFNFFGIINLWPLILVSIGLGFLIQNRPYSKPVLIVANLLICGIIFYQGVTNKRTFYDSIKISGVDNEDFKGFQKVSHEYHDGMDRVDLIINGGAAKYNMSTEIDSALLINAETNQNVGSLKLDYSDSDKNRLELTSKVKSSKYNNGNIRVGLNPNPIWDLEYNVGAASITADFKTLKLGSLTVNSGATNMSIFLPKPIEGTNKIEVNTAASKITFYLPKNAECRVKTETILSNNKFEDLNNTDGEYRKSNLYDSSNAKYDIVVEGAANSLKILRY